MKKLTNAERSAVRFALIAEGFFKPTLAPANRFFHSLNDLKKRAANPAYYTPANGYDSWSRVVSKVPAENVVAFAESYLKNLRPNRNPRHEQRRKIQYNPGTAGGRGRHHRRTNNPAAVANYASLRTGNPGGGKLQEIIDSGKAPAGYVH